MNARSWALLLAFVLVATACATDEGTARKADASDTGLRIALVAEDAPPLVTRPPMRRGPVEVTEEQYHAAMRQLAARLRHTLPPRAPTQVAVISWKDPERPDEQAELVREYYQWCEQRGTPGDCLGLLQDGPLLTEEDKQALAFALATRGVWSGTAAVIGEVLDPVQLQIALVSTITMTMALLAIPEPISKVVVIVLTASLVGYVGWDTLVGLIEGWRRLERECQQARTFAEVRAAGERYGQVMGEKVTRLLILAATAALASGGNKFISGGLPGLPQASRLATAEGLSFEVLGFVRSVKITGRILTVSLESNALLMANQGMRGGGSNPPPRAAASSAAASGSKHRLSSIESWRKPRLTEDGKILPFRNSRKPADPIPNLGRSRAGKSVTQGKTTIRFDKDGFPEFDPKFETLINNTHIGSGKHLSHFKAANEKLFRAIEKDPNLAKYLGLGIEDIQALSTSHQPPPGFRWHHHQDVGRMQLITEAEHRAALPHTGGMAIWGGGYPR
jgi:hypothetical protein